MAATRHGVRFCLMLSLILLEARPGCRLNEDCQVIVAQSGSHEDCRYEAAQHYCGGTYPYCDVGFTVCDDGSNFRAS